MEVHMPQIGMLRRMEPHAHRRRIARADGDVDPSIAE
jgi:hypothetical protein